MIVRTTILFLAGVAIAIALSVAQHSQTPQGMLLYTPPAGETAPNYTRVLALTTGSCGHRRQRAMFPDTFVAGAAHPERWA